MAKENELEIVIRAVDAATKELQKIQGVVRTFGIEATAEGARVNRSMRSQSEGIKQAAQQANNLHQEINKLTSGTRFLSEGVQSLRGMLNALTWGSFIGAATAATSYLIQLGIEAINSSKKIDELTRSVLQEVEALNKATGATRDLIQAKIERQAFASRGRASEIEKEIKTLQEQIGWEENLKKEVGEGSFVFDLANKRILDRKVRIAELNEQLKEQIRLEHLAAAIPDADAGKRQEALGFEFQQAGVAAFKRLQELRAFEAQSTLLDQLERTSEARKTLNIIEEALGEERLEEMMRSFEPIQSQVDIDLLVNKPSGESLTELRAAQIQKTLQLIDINHQLTQAYDHQFLSIDALGGGIGELARQMEIQNQVMEFGLALQNALNSGLQAWILGQQKLGPAIKAAIAQVLAAKAAEAGVNAIMATALGLYRLAENYGIPSPASIAAFTSAAQYATVGTAAGVAARQLSANIGGGSSGGVGGSGTPISPGSLRGPEQGPGQEIKVSLHIETLDPERVDWARVMNELGPALGDYLMRGGLTSNARINWERH